MLGGVASGVLTACRYPDPQRHPRGAVAAAAAAIVTVAVTAAFALLGFGLLPFVSLCLALALAPHGPDRWPDRRPNRSPNRSPQRPQRPQRPQPIAASILRASSSVSK